MTVQNIKRRLFFISLFIVFLFVFLGGINSKNVVMAKAEEGKTDLYNSVEEQIEKLELTELQKYVDSLGNFTDERVAERLLAYIEGEGVDYATFGKQLTIVLFAKVIEILPAFSCIAAVALLSGLISSLKSSSLKHTSTEMISLIAYVAALIPMLAILTECFRGAMESVSAMQQQMQIVFPLMLTLMAASGGTLTAAVCRPAVGFFATNIVTVISSVVFPITVTITAFSVAGNLSKELKISRFTAFFKSINKWVIGICISAFGIFFTLQGITAANYDGVVRRAAKYAIGNGVPIVGGFLSGGFDLAVAGSVLIKNALGTMSVFLMLAVIFEPIVLLISVNVLLRLTSAITQPFGEGRISDFLGETAENLHYCTAGLLFTAFLYFLTIMLLVCVSEALF